MTENSDGSTEHDGAVLQITNKDGKVVSRGFDPESGDQVFELELAPESAREFAYYLTKNSLEAEGS